MKPNLPLPRNIVLVGFMGSGKTTVGRALAALLGWAFVDTDAEIVQASGGKSIPEIFTTQGQAAFRVHETAAVHAVCSRESHVIATGGGVLLRAENADLLKSVGLVVWLTARPEVVVSRVEAERATRPLLAGANTDTPLLTHVLTMLGERGPLYQAAAHLVVDSSDLSPDALARHIARKAGL